MLYFAYGSNLNLEQMEFRCPMAVPKKAIALAGYRLVFRRYADIEPFTGEIVHGGLWDITEDCEEALDRYEGVSHDFYRKRYFKYDGEKVLFYQMTDTDIQWPSFDYAKTIEQGYKDFGLPLNFLYKAIKQSLAAKVPA